MRLRKSKKSAKVRKLINGKLVSQLRSISKYGFVTTTTSQLTSMNNRFGITFFIVVLYLSLIGKQFLF